jgi:predicted metal-dependent phosphoesterase TrpH
MVSKTSSISLLIMLCWLGLSAPSGARIGETLDQVLKRYGHCLGTVTADNGMTYKVFSRRGLKILVHFYENKVDEITYGKDADIFDDELKALMQDNAPGEWVGSGWPVNRWHNAAGISAHYSFEHRLLMIVTDAALEREKRRSGRSRLNIPDN